jgi:hypothetical protein
VRSKPRNARGLSVGLAVLAALAIAMLLVLLSQPTTNPFLTPSDTQPASPSNSPGAQTEATADPTEGETPRASEALTALELLPVKGRAPRTGYSRSEFSEGWGSVDGCDMRNLVLARDLVELVFRNDCIVESGVLTDPYTAQRITFVRGVDTSLAVQIDHVVAVSDAWQKGAQQLSAERRYEFYNDPLNLLAVSGEANQRKSDSDAASWLPANRAFRCEFVAIQIAVKLRYELWVTSAERDAMRRVLTTCPEQRLPVR